MGKRVPIKGSMAALLEIIGSLYKNPTDAIKEYVTNALDSWLEHNAIIGQLKFCEVDFVYFKNKIIIKCNSPGMTENKFEDILNKVAESIKKGVDYKQIGRLGIGLWAFNQVGKKCIFLTKYDNDSPTLKVTLKKGIDTAEFDKPSKHEELKLPGTEVTISGLEYDPTKPRGPLNAQKLNRVLSQKYDPYLRNAQLKIRIKVGNKIIKVKPEKVNLPRIATAYEDWHVSDEYLKKIGFQLWYDPTSKSKIAIRHEGVIITEDLRDVAALGIEESIYCSGLIKGYLDADFLIPLPSRTSFEDNEDWYKFLIELDKIRPAIEAEISEIQEKEQDSKATELYKQAIKLAKEILDTDYFKDLNLLKGMVRTYSPRKKGVSVPKGEHDGTRSTKPGTRESKPGFRINFQEIPFEEGAHTHSRFIAGTIQVNTSNQDYKKITKKTEKERLRYLANLIGKETIAYNDKSAVSNENLERLLTFYYRLYS